MMKLLDFLNQLDPEEPPNCEQIINAEAMVKFNLADLEGLEATKLLMVNKFIKERKKEKYSAWVRQRIMNGPEVIQQKARFRHLRLINH